MRHILVMGICGTGKTSLASALAGRLRIALVEADAHHAPDAIARMSRGEALGDGDRWDWLDRVAEDAAVAGGRTVIACSALKAAYRDRLAARLGPLDVVHLDGPRDLIAARMAARPGHYMPASLIDSQLADLETPDGPDVLRLSIAEPLDRLADAAEAFAKRSRAANGA